MRNIAIWGLSVSGAIITLIFVTFFPISRDVSKSLANLDKTTALLTVRADSNATAILEARQDMQTIKESLVNLNQAERRR